MNIDKIIKLGWVKRWSIPYSLLACSYAGVHYIKTCQENLGKGFDNIIFIHQDGVSTCYRTKSETLALGEYLAQKAVDKNEVLVEWSNRLKKETDRIRTIIKEKPENFLELDNYQRFEKSYRDYHPWAIANNTVPDFLPPDLIKKYQKILEDARMYSETVFDETEAFFKKILSLAAKKSGYSPKFITDIFFDELINYFENNQLPSDQELQKRYTRSGLFFNGEKRYVLSPADCIKFEDIVIETSGLKLGVVKGVVASEGHAIGICRIVNDPRKVDKFNEGDILVTGMTRPEFVPLMKKAGAIITDAGGLLSHAAIVSRELKKPCVIATEVATKAFKDGDKVEVDATNGIIKKI